MEVPLRNEKAKATGRPNFYGSTDMCGGDTALAACTAQHKKILKPNVLFLGTFEHQLVDNVSCLGHCAKTAPLRNETVGSQAIGAVVGSTRPMVLERVPVSIE